MEALPEEAPECALLGISTIAAVWTREGLGKKGGWQGGGEALFQLAKSAGAHFLNGFGELLAHGGQETLPRGKGGSWRVVSHRAVYKPPC